MAPTVTPPPFPGPFGSGPHPVLGEPSGRHPALRPNDGRGNISGAHRAVGEGSGTRSLVSVERVQQPATRRDIAAALTDGQGFEQFRQNHPYDDRFYAIAERVAWALEGVPVDTAQKHVKALVSVVLEAGTDVPEGLKRVLAEWVDKNVTGKGSYRVADNFCYFVELMRPRYRRDA